MMDRLPPEWRDLLALLPGYDSEATAAPTDYFDTEAAQLAIDFFSECLVLVEGHAAGEPFHLSPWQAAVTAALWGWRREDGSRRYREAFIYVPRKNSKTAWAAGLLCLELFTNPEAGCQLYAAAASREQASHIFRFASEMIRRSPEMSSRARIYRTYKSIEVPSTGSTFRVLSHEAATAHGTGPSFAIVDELHVHPDGELLETLLTGMGARKNPLLINITTADFDRPSPCNSKRDYAASVRDGVIEDSGFLPVLYEAAQDADWTDPEVWKAVNPNWGVSIQPDFLERESKRALADPTYELVFRRMFLNQRTTTDSKFLSVSDFDACEQPEPVLAGVPCYAGLDLSTVSDLSALVLGFPFGEQIYLKSYFFIPERKLQDSSDRVPYATWQRQGWLQVTPGEVIDYGFIRATTNELARLYSLQEIRFDPYNATSLSTQLAEEDGLVMTQMRQGYLSMSPVLKELQRRILNGTLQHDGNPVLRWNVANAVVQQDAAGNIKLAKDKATQRIDGVAAAAMAISGCLTHIAAPTYEVVWI